MPALEGKALDRYELRKRIGRGGMADVYEGYDPRFDRTVAVKVFKREDENMLRRFIREARLMAGLSHPHLVPIFDSGASLIGDITWYYIVMPFMEGGTLRARIRRAPLSMQEVCRDLRDIASALDYIHRQGIIHRDIKASNILLNAKGRCFLSDFGIARAITDETQLTSTGSVLGTVEYVAPELFENNRRADPLSDLYSLGVLLFEMVTGQLPFVAENQIALVTMHLKEPPPLPRSIVPDLPVRVERVILRALAKRPEQRYQSATELAEAFCHAVAGKNDSYDGYTTPAPRRSDAALPVVGSQSLRPATTRRTSPASRPAPVMRGSGGQTPSEVSSSGRRSVSQPPAARSRPGRRVNNKRSLVVGIIALLIVAVLIAASIYALMHPASSSSTGSSTPTALPTQGSTSTSAVTATLSPTATPNLTATAQAIVQVTATAQAHATAVAIAQITQTVEARPTATAGVIQTATSGAPIYQDALNDANNPATKAANWNGGNGNDSHCVFASDGYHVRESSNLNNIRGCREMANQYQNGAITVNVNMLSGHSGGLFFRLSTDLFGNYSGYLFEIDSKGNYKISNYGGATLQDWTPSSALKTGYNAVNTLQVMMSGSTLNFYVNGVFLTSETDTTHTIGEIGFLASTNGSAADVVYSNLKVYPQP